MTTAVRIGSPSQLAAAVPSLIGFVPAIGDGVLITFEDRRLGFTARFEASRASLRGMAGSLARSVRQQGTVTQVMVITYGPDRVLPRDVAAALRLASVGVPIVETLRVHDGRVFESEDDTVGEPLPEDVVRPAAILETGAVLRASRTEVEGLFDGPLTPPADDTRGLSRIVAETALRDQRIGMLADMDAEELAAEVDLAVRTSRCWPVGPIKDAALTYAALAAYVSGDGAMANIALDRVVGPYSLAVLLRQALAMAVPPSAIREMARRAAGK